MSDDLLGKGRRDRSHIAMGQSHEVQYWTRHLGVSKEVLQKAVDKVEQVSPHLPRGKPARGNDELCTEGTNAGIAGIKVHMNVIASCGNKVGVVDAVEGGAIKLTKNDSPDGQHHFIPMTWVETVDDRVHLNKNSKETFEQWKTQSASCCG